MDEKMKNKRDRIIADLIQHVGMSKNDAEFAADIELGILPKGDVIEVDENDSDK